ncbi:hypothetical protein FOZ61_010068 [Perkinsus olseni]|uniref:Uncharacterized protein n=1 Tax=Perkinsus olseni TaxID=32597 RepID=A0A7J6KYA4_PEROL|nr:hypothetical protein FOZ61_010068 [Perkinsus olseni]KAF4656835.1 hypothetical protein FOL46_007654 [Perkinsus olseni]
MSSSSDNSTSSWPSPSPAAAPAVSMLEQLQKVALRARDQAEDVGDDIRVGAGRPATPKATFDRIKVGMRCQVEPFQRRGEIAYIQPNHCGLGSRLGERRKQALSYIHVRVNELIR